MTGLVMGTIAANYDDNHPGMVQVSYPSSDSDERVTEWMPVAAPYAGKDYGLYFLVGEQVIVGFIGGDVHNGVFWALCGTRRTLCPPTQRAKTTTALQQKAGIT